MKIYDWKLIILGLIMKYFLTANFFLHLKYSKSLRHATFLLRRHSDQFPVENFSKSFLRQLKMQLEKSF